MKLRLDADGERLDRAVTTRLRAEGYDVSMREVREALKAGQIRIAGHKKAPASAAKAGDELDLGTFVPRAQVVVMPEPDLLARVSILFEDEGLLAVSKPSGMPVAPLAAGERGTLLAAVIAHAPEIATAGPPLEGGLGHRLDVETSGVVVFARDPKTRADLRAAFTSNQVEKRYLCLVEDPNDRWTVERTIETPLSGRGKKVRTSSIADGGLASETSVFPTRERHGGLSWLVVRPRTGRRHQIRVHLASEGTPIVSDPIYGVRHPLVPRLALHARSIMLLGRASIEAPVPADLTAPLVQLGFSPEALER